jgi:3'(2'), 5'-bisphosphate nucleotidase
MSKEMDVAFSLAHQAALATEAIRTKGVDALVKRDGSPLTHADIVSQAVILRGLLEHFPDDRILAEEEMHSGIQRHLRASACAALNQMGFPRAEDNLEKWVNYRGNPKGKRVWMIDPIDGTKGFQRNLPYAVAIGLFFDGAPQLGCIAAPLFPAGKDTEARTVIAFSEGGAGAYLMDSGTGQTQKIQVSGVSSLPDLSVIGSRAHDRENICEKFLERSGAKRLIRMDGQAKYIMVASGRSDVCIRAANPGYGIGYPWDHCAGQMILEGAGGVITTFSGLPLRYGNDGSPIKHLEGLVASNATCHDAVLALIREILKDRQVRDRQN